MFSAGSAPAGVVGYISIDTRPVHCLSLLLPASILSPDRLNAGQEGCD